MKIFTLLFDPSCNNSFSSVAHKNICAENSVNADKKKIKRLLLMPLIVLGFLFTNGNLWGQTTVTYAQRIAHYNAGTVFTVGTAGAFDQGTSQVGMYANGGTTKQVVAWRTLKTAGDNTGSDRSLQVGDEFRISVSAHTVFGEMGFALLSSPLSRSSWNDRLNNAAVSVRLSNYGNWYATYSDGTTANAATSNGSNNIGGTTSYKNFVFTCLLTAPNRMNITITDGTTTSNLNDVLLNNSNAITEYSIFSSDDWNGVQHRDIYWNTNSTAASDYVRNTLTMPIGGSNGSFTISGVLPNGRAANSTSTASVNALTKSGSGSLTLSGNNTYTGTTTISAGTLLLGAAGSGSNTPLGTTAGATTVSSGSALNLNGFTLATAEGLTINGTGISSGGALINSSGTGSTWIGTVALGSDSSVGGSGNTTLSGVVSGANSLTKVGAGNVTLSNTNTFGGAGKSLTIAQGTVAINSFGNALGNSANSFTLGTSSTSGTLYSTGPTGSVTRSFTVAAGGGTLEIAGIGTPTFANSATGTLNGEFTVNCSNSGDAIFSSGLSGAGGMTINSTGSGVVTMGASGAVAATYSGDTKITAGRLQLGLANMLPNSSKLVLNGGTFSTGATAGFAETVGTLQLTENSTILLGTGSHTINFSASNLTAWTAGKTLTITGWTGTASGGTAGRIYVGSSGSGLTQAQLDAINFTSQQPGAQIISGTGEIVPNFTVTITSAQSGDWNSTSTWVGGEVPASIDNVVIAAGHTVTVTAGATCRKVNYTGTGGTLTVNSGVTLTVTTAVAVDADANNNSSGTVSGSGTVSCGSVTIGSAITPNADRTTSLTSTISAFTSSGSLSLIGRTSGGFTNNSSLNLQSGTLSAASISQTTNTSGCSTSILMNGGAQTGTLIYSGTTTWSQSGSGSSITTLNGTGATVSYAASGNQTVLNTSYTNLTLSGSGNKTLAAFGISGTLSVQGSAVGITTAPTFGASSTLEFKNVGTKTTNAIEWPASSGPSNLIIDNSGSIVTMPVSSARTLSGNLTLTAGTLADAGNILTVQGNIAGTGSHTGAGSITMTGASKTISGATLTNLTLNNASGFTLNGSPTINGALTFTTGRLSIGSNTLNLAGTVASMTTSNNITGSSTSNLSITGSGTLGTLLFNPTTAGTTNVLNNLTINRSSTGVVNLGSALNLAGNLTVTNGSLRSSGANTLTMAGTTQSFTISNTSGGSVLGTDNSAGNDLTLAIATGSTTTLTGDATSTNDDDKKFFNVTVNTGGTLVLSRGILCKYGTFAVNGTLQINANGYLQTTPNGGGTAIAPTYGPSSLLRYNPATTYGRGLEWSTTSGAGYPNNVQVSNNTTLNVHNGSDVARQIAGNLTVDSGSTLSLEGMTIVSPTDIGLTVTGNVINNGSITLASSTERLKCVDFSNNAGATTTLSSNVGGDLELTGSLIDNATFNSNNRAVFFTGSGVQDVSGMGTFNIDYIVSNKAFGSIRMLTNLLVEGPNGGNAMTLNNSSDILNLNGFALTLGKASVASTLSGSGSIRGSSSSSISILGDGALGTIRFDQTTPGITNALNSLTINRTSSGSVTLANPFTVEGNLTITNGNLNLGTNRHTANALTLGSTAQTTSSSYGGTSSPAENINTTYFATALGYVNVGSCTTYNLTSTSATACLGSAATVTLSNTTTSELPIGTYTVHYTLSGANTGSGTSPMVVTSEGSGTFITANITNNGPTTITINFIRNGCVSEISANNTATIIINAVQTASVSASASSTTICSGASVTFTATPTNGGTPTYQWKVNGVDVSGETASTYTTTTLANNDSVTVVMTSTATPCLTGSPATSNAVVITVNPLPTASISGNNGPAVCSGSTITFTLTGTSGAVVTYNLNGGSNTTATLTGGTATVTVTGATASQTLNLVSVTDGTCPATLSGSSTVTVGATTTWIITSPATSPAWDNGTPTSTMTAVISANYSEAAALNACTLIVNSGAVVSIPSGTNVTVNGAVTVASGSSFTLNNNANLVQNLDVNNSGNIVVKRQTNPLIRLDYMLWSSPVAGQGLYAFSPFTFANRFYTYTYNATTLLTGGYSNSALGLNVTGTNAAGVNGTDGNSVPFGVGRGYLIRVPYNHPTAPAIWTGTFTGVPTNGDETVTLNNTAVGQRFNLIGNPYPSTLSMSQFVSDNSSAITGTLYFWRKTNSTLSSPGYCTWAGGTFVSNGEAQVNNPLGVIQVGQGFLVEASATGTSVTFNNGQRIANNANQVFRLNNSNFATPDATTTVEYNRIWLNMTSATEFAQMSVGYNTGATQEVDVFDGKYFNDGPIALNSIIGTTDYAIQGRALPFATNDVVPLSYKVTNAGNYTIALDQADGLFTAGAQDVFLKDNLNNTYTNLNTTSYTFASEVGTFNNRFEIVYENQLSVVTPTFTADNVVVYKNNEDFVVNSGVTTMSEITVYDIRGRVLQTIKGINATETRLNAGTTNQVLLLQIKTTEGLIVTKKVIN